MNFAQYQDQVRVACEPLDHRERVALCLMCCHRLAPLYLRFSAAEKWGDPGLLLKVRDSAAAWLSGHGSIPPALRAQIDVVIPDTEAFGGALVSHALNAGVAHADLLDLLADNKIELVLATLQNCYDSVDLFVRELLDPGGSGAIPERQIMDHAAMRAELDWQFASAQEVKSGADLINLVRRSERMPIFEDA